MGQTRVKMKVFGGEGLWGSIIIDKIVERGLEVGGVGAVDVEEAERVLSGLFSDCAETYDCCDGAVFEPLAEVLVRRAEVEEGSRVLDLGTGTGIAAFKALERVGPGGYVLGVDVAEGLLAVAEEKARRRGVENVEFRVMSMGSLDLPDGSFDRVIGNFSLCCTCFYDRAVGEAFRVLKPGGRLTYNHWGPGESPVVIVLNAVFSKFKVGEPSEKLRRVREASGLLESMWSRFKDPFAALGALEAAGFREREALISYAQRAFRDVEAFLDHWFTGGLGELELSEMQPGRRDELRRSLVESLKPFLSEEGLVVRWEILHLSGRK